MCSEILPILRTKRLYSLVLFYEFVAIQLVKNICCNVHLMQYAVRITRIDFRRASGVPINKTLLISSKTSFSLAVIRIAGSE